MLITAPADPILPGSRVRRAQRALAATIHATFALPNPAMLAFLIRKEEEIRTRIHSFKMPIKNAYLRNAVTALYFFAPIVGGYLSMSYVMPDPEQMREKLTANLSAEDLARIQAEKDRLQAEYNAARAKLEAARQQQR